MFVSLVLFLYFTFDTELFYCFLTTFVVVSYFKKPLVLYSQKPKKKPKKNPKGKNPRIRNANSFKFQNP